MDPSRKGFSIEQPIWRDSDRPSTTVKKDQPGGESSHNPSIEKIERAFSSRRQEKGKRSALSFSSAKSWFRKLKGPQRLGQSSFGHRTSVDLGERSIPTIVPIPARKSTSCIGTASTAGSRAIGGFNHSFSWSRKVPQCDNCRKLHLEECEIG